MSRAGPVLLVFVLVSLYLAAVPAEAQSPLFVSTTHFKGLELTERTIRPGEEQTALATFVNHCTFSPLQDPGGDPLDMTETLTAKVATDVEALVATIDPEEVTIEHSPQSCLEHQVHVFDQEVSYTLEEALPAGTPMMVKVVVESDWGRGMQYEFSVEVDPDGGLVVETPDAIVLDANGNGVAHVRLQNEGNAPLRLRFDPTVRGVVAAQPFGGEQVIGPGGELVREFTFHVQDGTGHEAALELVIHPSLATEPHTQHPVVIRHIPIDTGSVPQALSHGVQEAPALPLAVPMGILGLLALVRRRP